MTRATTSHRTSARLALVHLLFNRSSDPKEILPHVQILLQSNPDHPEYQVALARCKALQGDVDAARDLLDQVLEANPDFLSALPQTYAPIVRSRYFYGIVEELGLQYGFSYNVTFTNATDAEAGSCAGCSGRSRS